MAGNMTAAVVPEISAGDTAWVLTSTALVMLMTPGLAFFYGGLVNERNVLNTIMMSIISMGVVAVPWMLVGFSLAFGSAGGPVIGDFGYVALAGMKDTVWPGTSLPSLVFVVFQMTFAVIGAAIISGAVVERMRFGAWAIFITVWSLVVYAPICHWVWGPGGWIMELGAKDFAGGAVVHESTAISALVLAKLLGPRASHAAAVREEEQPHNVPTVILGAALLWFGWSGFNGGSALAADSVAALALINTYQAAGSALVAWSMMERWWKGRWSAVGSVTGAIVGLVVITPAAGFVSVFGACVMGALGAIVVYPSFQVSSGIDDSLDAFPCHGVSGIVGTLLTGFFAEEGGLFYGGGWSLLGAQSVACLAVMLYAGVATSIIYGVLRCFMQTRVDKDTEMAGIDSSLHGESAYCHTPQKEYPQAAKSNFATDSTCEDSSDSAEGSTV